MNNKARTSMTTLSAAREPQQQHILQSSTCDVSLEDIAKNDDFESWQVISSQPVTA